jgi:hypothetical protein
MEEEINIYSSKRAKLQFWAVNSFDAMLLTQYCMQ